MLLNIKYYNWWSLSAIMIIIAQCPVMAEERELGMLHTETMLMGSSFYEIILIALIFLALLVIIILSVLFIKCKNKINKLEQEEIETEVEGSGVEKNIFAADNAQIIGYDTVEKRYFDETAIYQYLGYSETKIKELSGKLGSIVFAEEFFIFKEYTQRVIQGDVSSTYPLKIRVYRDNGLLAYLYLLGNIREQQQNKIYYGVVIDNNYDESQQQKGHNQEEFLKLLLGEYGVSAWEWSREEEALIYHYFPENESFLPFVEQVCNKVDERFVASIFNYIEYVHPDDLDNLKRFVHNSFLRKKNNNDQVIHNQHRIIIAGITYTIYICGKIVEYDAEGYVSKIIGIAHNITERINEEARKADAKRLEAIGSLASGVALDFNNQLNGILGFVDLLERNEELQGNDTVQKHLQIIKSCAQKCEELITQLLAFARKSKEKYEIFELDAVIRSLVKMLQRSIDRSIDIELRLDAGYTVVEGDYSQLETALLNIMLNSCEAMQNGGKITIETDNLLDNYLGKIPAFNNLKNKDIVILKIKDTGKGMDSEVLDKIFEPFFTTKDIGKASGMGLSVVFGIIKNYGGEIVVDSRVGIGTTVYIGLPLKKGNKIEKRINKTEIYNIDYNKKLFGKVMVIDDEASVRALLKNYLDSFGCEVILAENGLEAVRKYKAMYQDISLVVSDISMPKLDGSKTFAELKRINSEVKVIFITGYAEDNEKVVAMLENGAIALLKKPLNRDKFYNSIRSALGQ